MDEGPGSSRSRPTGRDPNSECVEEPRAGSPLSQVAGRSTGPRGAVTARPSARARGPALAVVLAGTPGAGAAVLLVPAPACLPRLMSRGWKKGDHGETQGPKMASHPLLGTPRLGYLGDQGGHPKMWTQCTLTEVGWTHQPGLRSGRSSSAGHRGSRSSGRPSSLGDNSPLLSPSTLLFSQPVPLPQALRTHESEASPC